MENQSEINARIQTISKQNWQRLFDFIPMIDAIPSFRLPEEPEKDFGEMNFMPIIPSDQVINDFETLVYELGIIIDFDWPSWDDGRKLLENNVFTSTDVETLCKLLTAIVR